MNAIPEFKAHMEELFDITDENGNPTGLKVKRSEAHEKGILHRTAHVWIAKKVQNSYEVLLQKRSARKESFPSMYDTSSAGHVQAGDTPLESAIRELHEELGIAAGPDDFEYVGRFRIQYESVFHEKQFKDNEVAFVYLYKKPVNKNELILQTEEVEDVKWFPVEEVLLGTGHREGVFCVPVEGLEMVLRYLGKKDY